MGIHLQLCANNVIGNYMQYTLHPMIYIQLNILCILFPAEEKGQT